MKKQDIKAEIAFFNKAVIQGRVETASNELYEQVFFRIKPYLGDNIMEAGCGSGAFGQRIKREKPQASLIGVDLTPAMIDLAGKKKIYDSLFCKNIEDETVFVKEKFDTIVCPYLLHHLPSIQHVTNNFYKWLKPGGYLIIIDPNGSNLVLKFSYILRLIIMKIFIIQNNFASVNEKNKSISEFMFYLNNYKLKSVNTFFYNHKRSRSSHQASLLLYVFSLVRQEILKLYSYLPFIPFGGSDLIIVAKK